MDDWDDDDPIEEFAEEVYLDDLYWPQEEQEQGQQGWPAPTLCSSPSTLLRPAPLIDWERTAYELIGLTLIFGLLVVVPVALLLIFR